MENKKPNIELRAEEVHDIINAVPRKLIRYGSFSILLVVVLVIIGANYITYPDVLPANIIITTEIPPVKIIARSSGKIQQVFVKDQQVIKEGEVLALINSTANYQSILKLKKGLLFKKNNLPEINMGSLGEVATRASAYFNSRMKRNVFEELASYQDRIKALQKQLIGNKFLKMEQIKQRDLLEKEVTLTQKDFGRNKDLFAQNVISSQQFEAKEKEYLAIQRQLKAMDQSISATQLATLSLEETIINLKNNSLEDSQELKSNEESNLRSLYASIADWEQRYLLTAPISGKVSFINVWSENQVVEINNPVFWIEPITSTKILGKVNLPLRKSGKVKIGQEVHIKLDNYPFEEYGIVLGKVSKIGALPNQKFYIIDVEFPQGLKTSYGNLIPFHQQMSGSANIITQKLSLLDRVFYQFRKMYNTR